jgi:predicted permease
MARILRPGLRRLFRLPLRTSDAIHADVDEELASLIASRIDDLTARGMSSADARIEALRRLGASVDETRRTLHASAETRERRMTLRETMESAVQDIRYALRGLARRPGFTLIAVLTLAIGIGGTTAIFSAVNVLMLRPLPYARPEQLMNLTLITPERGTHPSNDHMVWSYLKYTAFRNAQQAFTDLSLYSDYQFILTSGDVERVPGEYVGATYFRTLGIPIPRGRDFDRALDDGPGAPHQIILSSNLWERRYNADPSIIGQTIDVDKQPYVVVGVAPREFKGLSGEAQLFMPVTTRPAANDLNEPQSHEFSLIGRRSPNIAVAQVNAAMKLLGERVNDAYPNRVDNKKWGARAEQLDNARLAPQVRRSLLVLFGAVGFVLLIACVNVANLLLGRASTRRREIAVRLAIGAGRARLVRLLMTESLCLAVIGGLASVGVAWLGVRALGTIDPATTLRMSRDNSFGAMTFSAITLDWTALAFTLGVAIVVGLLFGLVPAIGATRTSFTDALKHDVARGGRHSALSMRRVLVIAEVALAIVLLAGSGLMIRSLTKLLAINPGFDPNGVLTVRMNIPPGLSPDSMPQFYVELLDHIRAVPGVTDASLGNCAPLSGGCNATVINRLDRPKEDDAHSPIIGIDWATPTWFSTLRIPLKRGRMFASSDRMGAPKVVLINETAAKQLFPGEDPIGKHVAIGQGHLDDAEIVGVVGSVRQQPDSEPKIVAYTSYLQTPRLAMMIFIRTQRDPASIGPGVRRAIHASAPQYPMFDARTMNERVERATAQIRFSSTLLGLFAITALTLAAIGIYGVLALAVAARTREIGIRIALGAEQQRVRRLVIGEGVVLAGIGAAIGVAGALASTRLLQSMLFDLASTDPVTYVAIVAVLGAAAMAASWIPARRASRVDPMVALRTE